MRVFRRRRSSYTYALLGTVVFGGLIWYWKYGGDAVFANSDKSMRGRWKRYLDYKNNEQSRSGPGEQGKALHLAGEEKVEAERLMPSEAFNRIASDKISLERSIPDVRDPGSVFLTFLL